MLTALAGILGFLSNFLPKLLDLWRDKKDKEHEIALLKLQIEANLISSQMRLEEIRALSEINLAIENEKLLKEIQASYRAESTDIRWVNALRALVRPVITYAFFLLFSSIKVYQLYMGYIEYVWDDETSIIFATVIGFYFGSRHIRGKF